MEQMSIWGARTIFGLNGGWISRPSIFSQSMRRKNKWLRISSSPVLPQPKRFWGFFVRNWNRQITHDAETIAALNSWLLAPFRAQFTTACCRTYPFADVFRFLAQALRIGHIVVGDGGEQLFLVLAVERRLTDKHFIQQNTIGPPIDRFAVWLI